MRLCEAFVMETPEVLHVGDDRRGAFAIERDGARLATMTYSMAGKVAIIDHTEVSDVLKGTGAGKKLVAAAVEWARREGMHIVPVCSFAKTVFDRTPEYHDVLA